MKKVLILLFLCGTYLHSQSIKYLESGTSATQGFEFWSVVSGTVTSDTTTFSGPRSIKLTTGSNIITANGTTADAGSRISLYTQFTGTWPPTGQNIFLSPSDQAGAGGFAIVITAAAKVGIVNNTFGTPSCTGTTTLSASTWYRIGFSYTVTSSTVNTIKVFLNGNTECTATNITVTTGKTALKILGGSDVGTSTYIQNIYIDNGTTVDDIGDVRVTAKLPTTVNVSNGTSGGTGALNERPINTTNRYSFSLAQNNLARNYNLESSASGDVDVSSATYLGYVGWVYEAFTSNVINYTTSTNASDWGTTGTTLSINAPSVNTGDIIVCGLADQVGGSTPTIADNQTNTWSLINSSTNTVRKTTWYSNITSGTPPTTITITFASSNASRAAACVSATNPYTTPLDVSTTNLNDSTSPYDSNASGTLADANEMAVGSFALVAPREDTFAKGASELNITTSSSAYGQTQAGSCTNNLNSTATSMTCSGIGGASGDLIVVVVADQKGGTAPSILDGGSNTYTALTGGTNTIRCQAWYSRVSNAPGTITATLPSTNASAAIAAYRFTGSLTTPLDKNPTALSDSSSPYTGPLSTTLAQANELLITYGCLTGPSSDTTTASTNVTALVKGASTGGSAASNSQAIVGYQFQSATTSVQGSFTNSTTTRAGIVGTATFKTSGLTISSDSTIALTTRFPNSTSTVTAEMTDSTANRTGIAGLTTFKGYPSVNSQITVNGTNTNITVPISFSLITVAATSATYPSNAAGIGIVSGGPGATSLAEMGVLEAYIPGSPPPSTIKRLLLMGVGQE